MRRCSVIVGPSLLCLALGAGDVSAQIPSWPCLHPTQVLFDRTQENCPARPATTHGTWRISCAPICYNETIHYVGLTVVGQCFRYLFLGWDHCAPSSILIWSVTHDSFVASGFDGKRLWWGGCGSTPRFTFTGCSVGCNDTPPCDDPLIVSLEDENYSLTNTADGVPFDLSGDGDLQQVPWTARGSDDAFLVLDRNSNGQVDSGLELFSHVSPQPASDAPHGFRALAVFDEPLNGGNSDGKITTEDEIFSSLRLWLDKNHDGSTGRGELLTLSKAGLTELNLSYTEANSHTDIHGNTFKYSAPAHFENGRIVDAWVVFFNLESCPACRITGAD